MDDSRALQVILSKLNSLEEGQKTTNNRLNTMDEKLSDLGKKVTAVREDVEELKENSEITRNGVNTLLDWAEKVQVQVSIPLYKKED